MPDLIDIPTFSDARGSLSVFDGLLPFKVKRIYYLHGLPRGSRRAGHRHLQNRQALVCLAGRCEVYTHDGCRERNYELDAPDKALLLETEDWHYLHNFASGSVILVLASESYDPDDYIIEPYA